MKLVQKHIFKGTREFEIVDDVINVRVKSLLKEEKITLGLTTLVPDPAINQPYLEFNSRVTGEPQLSLLINKPNTEEFNAFVEALKYRVLEAYDIAAGYDTASKSTEDSEDVYERPAEFGQSGSPDPDKKRPSVNAERVGDDIRMLEQYLNTDDIKPLLVALEALKVEPQNESVFLQVVSAFNDLGPMQGAVLTYAPYITVLLSYEVGGDQTWAW